MPQGIPAFFATCGAVRKKRFLIRNGSLFWKEKNGLAGRKTVGDKAAREVTAGRRQSRGRRMIFFFGSGRQRGGKTPGPFKKGVDRCRRPGHRATKCRVTGTPPPPEGMSRRREEEEEEEEEEGRLGGARRGRREDRRDTGNRRGCGIRGARCGRREDAPGKRKAPSRGRYRVRNAGRAAAPGSDTGLLRGRRVMVAPLPCSASVPRYLFL